MAPNGDPLPAPVGSRVNCSGSYGTVKYIGEVVTTKGIWVGVEWDDPTRGKHNGTYQGVHYFQTSNPTSGSFVRPTKLSIGVSCVEAIKSRYGEVKGDETAGVDKENLARCQRKLNARFMEVVGFDKINKMQSQFDKLRVVGLREYNVINAGSPGDLRSLCPKITDLDLSKNLLNNWHTIADIVHQLELVRILNVSENKLTIPDDPVVYQSAFQTIRHIVLGMMDYSWSQILKCSLMWPDLNELQVQFNQISSLEIPPPGILSKLTHLDFEGNDIGNWAEINKVGDLPLLEVMNLTNVGITTISFPEGSTSGKTDLFPMLRDLNLCRNKINSWVPVCQLDKLKQLKELRFHVNPLLDENDVDTNRQLTIVSVGSLAMLNGVVINRDERKGAEYDYLKELGKKWLATKLENNEDRMIEFQSLHPRYAFLIKKYGMPEEGEMKAEPTKLSSNVINVEIFCPDGSGEAKTKKLPKTLMVQKLIGFVQRLFDTGTEIPKLSYISSRNPDAEFPFDNELKELNFYSIEDGDKICVRW